MAILMTIPTNTINCANSRVWNVVSHVIVRIPVPHVKTDSTMVNNTTTVSMNITTVDFNVKIIVNHVRLTTFVMSVRTAFTTMKWQKIAV